MAGTKIVVIKDSIFGRHEIPIGSVRSVLFTSPKTNIAVQRRTLGSIGLASSEWVLYDSLTPLERLVYNVIE